MSDTSLDVQAHRHTDKRLAKDTRHLLRQKMSQKQKKRVPVGVISIFHMLQVWTIFLEASKLQQFPQQPLLQMYGQAFRVDLQVLQQKDTPWTSTTSGQTMNQNINDHRTHHEHQQPKDTWVHAYVWMCECMCVCVCVCACVWVYVCVCVCVCEGIVETVVGCGGGEEEDWGMHTR